MKKAMLLSAILIAGCATPAPVPPTYESNPWVVEDFDPHKVKLTILSIRGLADENLKRRYELEFERIMQEVCSEFGSRPGTLRNVTRKCAYQSRQPSSFYTSCSRYEYRYHPRRPPTRICVDTITTEQGGEIVCHRDRITVLASCVK